MAVKTIPAPPNTAEQNKALKITPRQLQHEFTMPRPKLGDLVLWYPDWREATVSRMAFVTGLGENSISVVYFIPDDRLPYVKQAVYHRDDPHKQRIDDVGEGVWSAPDGGAAPPKGDTFLAGLIERLEQSQKMLREHEVALKGVATLESEVTDLKAKLAALTATVANANKK